MEWGLSWEGPVESCPVSSWAWSLRSGRPGTEWAAPATRTSKERPVQTNNCFPTAEAGRAATISAEATASGSREGLWISRAPVCVPLGPKQQEITQQIQEHIFSKTRLLANLIERQLSFYILPMVWCLHFQLAKLFILAADCSAALDERFPCCAWHRSSRSCKHRKNSFKTFCILQKLIKSKKHTHGLILNFNPWY